LVNRDEVQILGYNSRLDTLQAVVGNWLIPQTEDIALKRIKNAAKYDAGLRVIPGVEIPPRPADFKIVYHLYMVFAEKRDELLSYCQARGIEAKVHYPVPIYRQEALKAFGPIGEYPVTDRHARSVISFPCDQHLTDEEVKYVISTVADFYAGVK
jgi:dTDP-4-amino-4,6-dideoxygalactose transaminase